MCHCVNIPSPGLYVITGRSHHPERRGFKGKKSSREEKKVEIRVLKIGCIQPQPYMLRPSKNTLRAVSVAGSSNRKTVTVS